MNIATQLGLDDLDSGPLADATDRWPSWAIEYPVLAPAGGPAQLRGWLLAAPGQQRNEVLCALAQLSTDRADEGLAAAGSDFVDEAEGGVGGVDELAVGGEVVEVVGMRQGDDNDGA